jgi:hypothetical protein
VTVEAPVAESGRAPVATVPAVRRAGLWVLIVCACAGLGACGGSVDASSACDLVTDGEAERLLGVAVRPATEDDENEGPGSTCEWISADSSREPEAAVYGFYVAESSDRETRGRFRATRRDLPDGFVAEGVAELGDDAYFVVSTEPTATGMPSLPYLQVRLGDRIVQVGTFDRDDRPVTAGEARALEVGAAQLALDRLAADD